MFYYSFEFTRFNTRFLHVYYEMAHTCSFPGGLVSFSDQKFRKFRVGERMEQTFSRISFRNFGCTSRGWPKIPENRNNRIVLFHSTIPTRAVSPGLEINMADLKLLNIILVLYQTNDWNILLQRYCSGLASQALVSSAKIQSYVKCEHNRSSEKFARHSKVTLELVRKIERYRKCSRGLLLNSDDKSDIVTLT